MSKLTPLRVLIEREVTLSDFKALRLPSIFESRGWLSVIGPPKPANVQIVREFYTIKLLNYLGINNGTLTRLMFACGSKWTAKM
ncbi:hypothetical protein L3X38_011639 [Prunus dulcis]|uniref:Uncharacterized protein n=1 Tax=Prunus dulcis TaxID=3755 RepID=A0AAD4ZFW4_PRUDU|nr:hypothetical protein L3X38_011639 [Prunus dulcis]